MYRNAGELVERMMSIYKYEQEYVFDEFIKGLDKDVRKELLEDRDVVLVGIKLTGGFILKYASEELKNDKELALEAIKAYNRFTL